MDTDRNLLLGVRALQDGLIDAPQFVEACISWSTRPGAALTNLLVERGWIDSRQRYQLERLVQGDRPQHDSSVTVDVVAGEDATFALEPKPAQNAAKPPTLALL